ncbi:RagB/SusD family nutrient uptake outer membrane protein [Guyparkeria sp.]|uniref:RagB/SusD family nutrient uptake outer membrane protein n=1 Tax=Guyparkeria sp. TaxID=2035736 RepID=UPI003970EF0C
MMRTIKYILITTLMAGFVFLASCTDEFLQKEPPGSAAGSVMATGDGVEALLIGAYDRMRCIDMFGGAMATDWTYGECASDNAYKGTSYGDQAPFNLVERYEVLPDNGYMAARWREGFNGVARANEALTYLALTQEGETPIGEPRASQIEAEAKFLRAYFHFKLTRIFRNIPYIKTVAEMDGTFPEDVPNTSEGWDEIEADLQFAIDNLPESHPLGQVGRPTRYSAMAMKAHAHMYQNELNLAKPLLDNIITNGGFELVANYNENYDAHFNNNEESIFEIQIAVAGETTGSTINAQRSWAHQSGAVGIGWGFYQPSQDLFDAFQTTTEGLPILDKADRPRLANDMGVRSDEEFIPTDANLDPRVDWTIARRGIDFLGWSIHEGMSWIRAQDNGGPYMTKKFHHQEHEQGLARQGQAWNARNVRIYRLSHILLWRAEIAVEDGDLDYARELVNQIRERARTSTPVMGRVTTYILDGRDYEVDWEQPAANYNIATYPAGSTAFANQTNARKAVRLEIRLEFATEGHRFFDLRRWGIIDEVLNDYIERDSDFRSFMRGAVFNSPRDEYWPLPQAQLDIQDVLTQDPNF